MLRPVSLGKRLAVVKANYFRTSLLDLEQHPGRTKHRNQQPKRTSQPGTEPRRQNNRVSSSSLGPNCEEVISPEWA
jgi:hypothetical protein